MKFQVSTWENFIVNTVLFVYCMHGGLYHFVRFVLNEDNGYLGG